MSDKVILLFGMYKKVPLGPWKQFKISIKSKKFERLQNAIIIQGIFYIVLEMCTRKISYTR